MFLWCWPSVYDAGPASNQHWIKVCCLTGYTWYQYSACNESRALFELFICPLIVIWFNFALTWNSPAQPPSSSGGKLLIYLFNPFSPHDALKHHLTSLRTDLIFLQQRVLERKFPWNWRPNTWQFSLIFKPHQIISIHYKSRIATAIRGLYWMEMTMVNSGLKGLIWDQKIVIVDVETHILFPNNRDLIC